MLAIRNRLSSGLPAAYCSSSAIISGNPRSFTLPRGGSSDSERRVLPLLESRRRHSRGPGGGTGLNSTRLSRYDASITRRSETGFRSIAGRPVALQQALKQHVPLFNNKPSMTINRSFADSFRDLKGDAPASIAVALVALPLCLGIAIASNAPPMAGIVSGIIGGIIVGMISRSQTSVSGPAAGLTAVILSAMATFEGHFEILLMSVVLCGFLQILLGVIKAGFVANYFPSSVIRGLLAAIGLILIFKQIPHAFGIDRDPEGDFSFFQPDSENTFSELIHMVSRFNPGAIVISVVCLAIILLWDNTRLKKLLIPSSLLAVAAGIAINFGFSVWRPEWALEQSHLVTLPKFESFAEIGSLTTFPDWGEFWGEHTGHILFIAVELAIVASLETLLNIEAVDKLDPRKRHSPPDRELLAQGVGNVTAGFLGGLPVTSVVVRSSMNVSSGSISKKSAIMHGVILAASVAFLPKLLNAIPLAALAAILLTTGYKLASFGVFREFVRRGPTQYLPFFATIIAILFSDLLIGITIGMAVGVYFVLLSNSKTPYTFREEKLSAGNVLRYKLSQQVTFLNRASLLGTLASIPDGARVVIDATDSDYVDQDILQLLKSFKDEEAPVRGIQMKLAGFRESYSHESDVDYVNVLTATTRDKLAPADILRMLIDGNTRFSEGQQTQRDLLRQVTLTSDKQHPMAAVLSCIDSRTTSELIFDLGLGDIFSVRVAGNVINEDVLGSLEYATKVVGARLIVVKGHTNCGAINAACDDVQFGNVTGMLKKIHVAIDREHETKSSRDSSNKTFVNNVTRLNTLSSVEQILKQSPTIADLVNEGSVAIVGAIYNTTTGKIEFFGDLVDEVLAQV